MKPRAELVVKGSQDWKDLVDGGYSQPNGGWKPEIGVVFDSREKESSPRIEYVPDYCRVPHVHCVLKRLRQFWWLLEVRRLLLLLSRWLIG